MTPMSCQAPRRCSQELPGGGYYSKAWTVKEVKAYRAIGGWFIKGHHEFADRAAAIAAGVNPDKEPVVSTESKEEKKLLAAIEGLSDEEKSALLEKLK